MRLFYASPTGETPAQNFPQQKRIRISRRRSPIQYDPTLKRSAQVLATLLDQLAHANGHDIKLFGSTLASTDRLHALNKNDSPRRVYPSAIPQA